MACARGPRAQCVWVSFLTHVPPRSACTPANDGGLNAVLHSTLTHWIINYAWCLDSSVQTGGGGKGKTCSGELLALPNWQLFLGIEIGYGNGNGSPARQPYVSEATTWVICFMIPALTLARGLLFGPIAKTQARAKDVRERVKKSVRRKCARYMFLG